MAAPGPLTLRGERLVLRSSRPEDLGPLTDIVSEPQVARWWGTQPLDLDYVTEPGKFTILVDDAIAGWLACEEETEPDYRHVALDIFLTTALHGRGLGPEALRLAIGHYAALGHHRFTIDPAAANTRAIAAYTAVGFRPVGLMRDYERGPDGTWHDGLLMDLLTSELEPG